VQLKLWLTVGIRSKYKYCSKHYYRWCQQDIQLQLLWKLVYPA